MDDLYVIYREKLAADVTERKPRRRRRGHDDRCLITNPENQSFESADRPQFLAQEYHYAHGRNNPH
jgi:hypothetical protein